MIIDAHQHFWKYNPSDYVWMEDWMHVLKSDHEPQHLRPLIDAVGVSGTVAVQARQMISETDYLLELAGDHEWILGVVGWFDFSAGNLEETVENYAENSRLVGVRELIHDMADPEYAISRTHTNAIRIIGKSDLTYDLLLRPQHIAAAIKLVDLFPDQRFVVDHIAKPNIAANTMEPWKTQISILAERPNVYCKLSGMVTEADPASWTAEDIRPYVDICLESFGPSRLMVGSDWPVCTLAGSYETTMAVVLDYLQKLSPLERDRVFHGTCEEAYRLPINHTIDPSK
jgi:L-fuconolactonase